MANNYDYCYNRTRFARSMYKDFAQYVMSKVKNGNVLELGCGTGIVSSLLRKNGVEFHCMDFSSNMIKIAKTRCPHCVQSDLEFLPFRQSSFDLVFVHSALHHFPDLYNIMREAKRVLKSQGLFIVQEPGISNIRKDFFLRSMAFCLRMVAINLYEDVSHLEMKPSDHHSPIPIENLVYAMEQVGFIILEKRHKYYASQILAGFNNPMVHLIGRILDNIYVRKYNDGYMFTIVGNIP
jgi:ubiquinone/menaquinone biosynthesis C-methylase UbiE